MQQHQGTAGFNDGDGSEGAGVFRHDGGYIRDQDGQIRYYEPDPPGWYYWFEGPDNYRYLRGPYPSQAEAEAELEEAII